jgi:hypothetical protein
MPCHSTAPRGGSRGRGILGALDAGSDECGAGAVRSKSRWGIDGLFFSLPPEQQQRRIRELLRAGLSCDLIAMLTQRGVDAVRAVIAGHP